jgi:hypothetical protein
MRTGQHQWSHKFGRAYLFELSLLSLACIISVLGVLGYLRRGNAGDTSPFWCTVQPKGVLRSTQSSQLKPQKLFFQVRAQTPQRCLSQL